MISFAADVLVALVALVTAVPALVALRPRLATRLYGIDLATAGPVVTTIVTHRAVFFAVVAGLLFTSIAIETWRAPALFAAFTSKLAFLALARHHGALATIARTDIALITMLAAAAALRAG